MLMQQVLVGLAVPVNLAIFHDSGGWFVVKMRHSTMKNFVPFLLGCRFQPGYLHKVKGASLHSIPKLTWLRKKESMVECGNEAIISKILNLIMCISLLCWPKLEIRRGRSTPLHTYWWINLPKIFQENWAQNRTLSEKKIHVFSFYDNNPFLNKNAWICRLLFFNKDIKTSSRSNEQ